MPGPQRQEREHRATQWLRRFGRLTQTCAPPFGSGNRRSRSWPRPINLTLLRWNRITTASAICWISLPPNEPLRKLAPLTFSRGPRCFRLWQNWRSKPVIQFKQTHGGGDHDTRCCQSLFELWSPADPVAAHWLRAGSFIRYSRISFPGMAHLFRMRNFPDSSRPVASVAPADSDHFPNSGLSEFDGLVHVFAFARLLWVRRNAL